MPISNVIYDYPATSYTSILLGQIQSSPYMVKALHSLTGFTAIKLWQGLQ
jgi:hypothetical protein